MTFWNLWLSLLLAAPPRLVIHGKGLILEVHGAPNRSVPVVTAGDLTLSPSGPQEFRLVAERAQGTLETPESLEVFLQGVGNGIALQNLAGRVVVQTDYSQIKIQNFRGTVTVGGRGNQVSMLRSQGILEGRDEFGDLSIQQCSGIVDLTGRLSSIEVESFEGLMRFALNGWLQVRHARGSFELNSDYLHGILEDLEGLLRATTKTGSLRLYNIRGSGVVHSQGAVVIPRDAHGIRVIYAKEGR